MNHPWSLQPSTYFCFWIFFIMSCPGCNMNKQSVLYAVRSTTTDGSTLGPCGGWLKIPQKHDYHFIGRSLFSFQVNKPLLIWNFVNGRKVFPKLERFDGWPKLKFWTALRWVWYDRFRLWRSVRIHNYSNNVTKMLYKGFSLLESTCRTRNLYWCWFFNYSICIHLF